MKKQVKKIYRYENRLVKPCPWCEGAGYDYYLQERCCTCKGTGGEWKQIRILVAEEIIQNN